MGRLRWQAKKQGFRSGLELKVREELSRLGVTFQYEERRIPFTEPEKKRHYTPDFDIPSTGVTIEVKGRLTKFDREKLLLVREQNPELRLVLLFGNARNKIYKGSPTSYSDWADKHGIEWGDIKDGIPPDWYINEDSKNSTK